MPVVLNSRWVDKAGYFIGPGIADRSLLFFLKLKCIKPYLYNKPTLVFFQLTEIY
jgi:hypothetical protein